MRWGHALIRRPNRIAGKASAHHAPGSTRRRRGLRHSESRRVNAVHSPPAASTGTGIADERRRPPLQDIAGRAGRDQLLSVQVIGRRARGRK